MNNIQAYKIPPSTTTIIAKFYSAVSKHCFALIDIVELKDVVAYKFIPTVILPNKSTLT